MRFIAGPFRALVSLGLLAAMLQPALVRADEKKELELGRWYPTAEAGLNFTQSAYSTNWSGGDRGSIVWTAIFNSTLENQVSPKANSFTTLKLAFGQTHQQVVDAKGDRSWDKPEKSTDLIDLESILRLTLGGFVDPFASVRLESQFQDASDPFGRNLTINPLKFKESAGIARKFIDEEDRSLLSRLGFTFRQSARRTFLTDDPGDRSTGTETANDGGIELITDYHTKILEDRVTWASKLTFYQPVFYSGQDALDALDAATLAAAGVDADVADFTKTMDIDWENIFTTQITKIISVNLYTRWVYDKYDNTVLPALSREGVLENGAAVRTAVRKAGQFKQTLALGLTYRFL